MKAEQAEAERKELQKKNRLKLAYMFKKYLSSDTDKALGVVLKSVLGREEEVLDEFIKKYGPEPTPQEIEANQWDAQIAQELERIDAERKKKKHSEEGESGAPPPPPPPLPES